MKCFDKGILRQHMKRNDHTFTASATPGNARHQVATPSDERLSHAARPNDLFRQLQNRGASSAAVRSGGLADGVELGDGFLRQRETTGGEVFAQVFDRRGARNEQNVGRALQEPGEGHL